MIKIKMKEKFYITVPIYYVNWDLHIGHFYSTAIADTIARFNRISWKNTRFTTGVDENSQKAIAVAEEKNMPIMEYLDMMAQRHKDTWDNLHIEYTDFIRTTEQRHHKKVREVLDITYKNGDIYEGMYEWMYCVGCEAFKKDEDLIEKDGKKVCPDHLKKPDKIKEKNYFFKLSNYWDKLLTFYEENPDFIVPRERYNEVIAFVKRGLEDFSISRETNTFGIKLPFDETQVAYVWYDALFNYVTSEPENWPADLHVVWKDIIKFHGIYWPAMLMAAWYELPKQILTTGFFTIDGHKISKSIGNVIDPVEFSKEYSKDMLLLYLLSSFHIWNDGDFDTKQALLTYNAKLANNLWNLVNRVVVLSLKLSDKPWELFGDTQLCVETDLVIENIQKYNLKDALDECFRILDELNKYTDEKQPWVSVKADTETTREVLYTIAEWLRQVWLCLYAFFPEKMHELFHKIGVEWYKSQLEDWKLPELRTKTETFKITEKWDPLFLRFNIES